MRSTYDISRLYYKHCELSKINVTYWRIIEYLQEASNPMETVDLGRELTELLIEVKSGSGILLQAVELRWRIRCIGKEILRIQEKGSSGHVAPAPGRPQGGRRLK